MNRKSGSRSRRYPPQTRTEILALIRSALAAMPAYEGDANLIEETTPALRSEVEFVEVVAIRDHWPLRLGFLWHDANNTWRHVIEQCDIAND